MVVYFSRLHRIARLRSDSNGARVEPGIFQRGWLRRIQVRRLANYNRMLRDPLFMKSLGVTTVYVLCLVPGLYVSGLGLALLVLQTLFQETPRSQASRVDTLSGDSLH